MSRVPRRPHWWNRVAVKTKRKESFSVKMSFVSLSFTIVFYILFMWIGVTNTSDMSRKPFAKEIFDPLNSDVRSPNTDFQSSKFCIQNYQRYSGRSKTMKPNVGVVESRPIACGPDENETRYIIYGERWRTTNLTYNIRSYPRRTAILGGCEVIDKEFKKAFTLWESVSKLKFTRRKDLSDPDINISFPSMDRWYSRCFRDLYPHACSTVTPGDMLFKDDTEWTIGTSLGADIFQIAVHNIGHTLGLGHYQHNGSVMCYRVCNNHVYRSNFTLHSDDIEAIKLLYGKALTRPRAFNTGLTTHHKQEHKSLLELPTTWIAIGMACIILEVIIIVVGVIQIIRFRKQASERYWTKVEFGVSLK